MKQRTRVAMWMAGRIALSLLLSFLLLPGGDWNGVAQAAGAPAPQPNAGANFAPQLLAMFHPAAAAASAAASAMPQAPVSVTLGTITVPSSGEAGVNNVYVSGTGFPAGTILPASVRVTFATSCGGASVASTSPSLVQTIVGTTRRLQVLIPGGLGANTYYLSVSGTTTTGTAFASVTCSQVQVTVPSATLSPNSGARGQQNLSVLFAGVGTHFSQGVTTASFGAGISVASLTVNSATSATAVVNIAGNAALGASNVTVSTGSEVLTLVNAFAVTAATLVSIAVTPVNPSVAAGKTQQFTATGTYSDSSTQNLTASVTWASSSTATATISGAGLASALKAGSTTISATSGSIVGSTTLTVTAATLVSIAVTPVNPSVAAGKTQQFTATGTYSDSSTQNLTASVTWASSSTATATINSAGLASALKVGSTTISATSGSIVGSTTLTVTAATLVSIAVTPVNPSVAAGKTQQFTATGTYSDSSTQNLTASVTWASSSTATATISGAGLASALKAGSTTISATSGSIVGSTTLTVTAATLVSIAVTPVNPSVAAGGTQQFTATGTYSDSSTQNLTASVTWASSSTATATINSAGLASALKVGSTTISATSGSIVGSTTLTVTAATLVSIAVTPVNPSVAAGGTQQFTATGTYSDSSTQNLTASVTWASSSTATATISGAGLASALKVGSTTISATSGSIVGSTTLTVTAATLVSIAVTPVNPSVAAGGTQQFTATGTYSDSSTQNLTASVTWASSSTA